MKTISQRELRTDIAGVIRGVEQGESYTITRRGVPVGRLVPLGTEPDLRCDRPATKRPSCADRPRVRIGAPTSDLVEDPRGAR